MSRNLIPQRRHFLVSSTVTAMAFAGILSMLVFTAVNAQGGVGGTMNGRCDEEICVCKVEGSTMCPEWIKETSVNGWPYDTTSGSSCAPSDGSSGGSVLCTGWVSDFFTEYPNGSSTCTANEDGSYTLEYILWDGNSTTTSPPLMNYTENDSMPDCSQDIPFTLVPSSMPTISPAPTPTNQPTSNAPAIHRHHILVHFLFSVVSIGGMATTTMLVLH